MGKGGKRALERQVDRIDGQGREKYGGPGGHVSRHWRSPVASSASRLLNISHCHALST